MSHLIITAAGDSTRFNVGRPKWALTHPDGQLVIQKILHRLRSVWPTITVVAQKKHWQRLAYTLPGEIGLVLLEEPTADQVETVLQALSLLDLGGHHTFCVKDADNLFELPLRDGNFVATARLSALRLTTPGEKSYVRVDAMGRVRTIAEKQVLGDIFCAGAYGFNNVEAFQDAAARCGPPGSRYLSHVIFELLSRGTEFYTHDVSTTYQDWGTLETWQRMVRSYSTLFVDLDGVLVENAGQHVHPVWGTTPALPNSVAMLRQLPTTVRIVLTTSRPDTPELRAELVEKGIPFDSIVGGLPHGPRILINDTAPTAAGLTAQAITVPRNSDTLATYLAPLLRP